MCDSVYAGSVLARFLPRVKSKRMHACNASARRILSSLRVSTSPWLAVALNDVSYSLGGGHPEGTIYDCTPIISYMISLIGCTCLWVFSRVVPALDSRPASLNSRKAVICWYLLQRCIINCTIHVCGSLGQPLLYPLYLIDGTEAPGTYRTVVASSIYSSVFLQQAYVPKS